MSDTKTESRGGVTVVGLLGVLFVALKLTGLINWSWLWVLAPFWIPAAIAAMFVTLFLIIVMIKK